MKMRNVFCLALVFLVGITASVNAQVAIGKQGEQVEPHEAAILDLQSTTKGLLLPRVALNTDDLTEFKLEGEADKASATGMLVYNTTDKKVYCWNGDKWNCMVKASLKIPEITGYSPDKSLVIDVPLNGYTDFIITVGDCSEELVYEWSLVSNFSMNPNDLPMGTETKKITTTGTFRISQGTVTGGDYQMYYNGCIHYYLRCVISLKNYPEVKITSDYFILRGHWVQGCPV